MTHQNPYPTLHFEQQFFDSNLITVIRFFNKEISSSDLEVLKYTNKHSLDRFIFRTQQLFRSINDSWNVARMPEILCIFCLNDASILLMFQRGIKIYHFESKIELRNFISVLEIDWIIGDDLIFINPNQLDGINNVNLDFLEVCFSNGVFFKFMSLKVPADFSHLCAVAHNPTSFSIQMFETVKKIRNANIQFV